MKKLSLLLAVTMLAATLLVGCGGDDSSSDSSANSSTSQDKAYDGFSFELKGEKVELNAEMAPLVDALGDADNYFESESCAFQGLDKVYTYGSVVITTYPENEVDYVYSIELKDDTVETAEGVYIGASKDDVITAYGDGAEDTGSALIYTKGESQLNFMLNGDVVSSIVYLAITE